MEGATTGLNKCTEPVPGNLKKQKQNIHIDSCSTDIWPAGPVTRNQVSQPLCSPVALLSWDLWQLPVHYGRTGLWEPEEPGNWSDFPWIKVTCCCLLRYLGFDSLVSHGSFQPLFFTVVHVCVQGNGATAMTSCCRCASAQLRVFAPWTWSWSQVWQTTSQVQKIPLFIDVLAVARVDFQALFQINCCGLWIVNLTKSLTCCTDPSKNDPMNYNRWWVFFSFNVQPCFYFLMDTEMCDV